MGLFNDAGEAFNQVTDTIGDASEFGEQLVSDAGEAVNQVRDGAAQLVSDAGEAANQVTDTIDKTVNNFLPEDIGKNLGLALYGILAVAGIILFLYTLSLLKPVFEIGSNVT